MADDGYEIGPMRRDEYEKCVDVACEAFMKNNPLIKHLGIPADVWRQFTVADIPPELAIDTGLSLVARSKADGSPMAFVFLVVANFRIGPPKEIWTLHPGLDVLKDIVDQCYDKAIMKNGLRVGSLMNGRTLRCAMGGTMPAAESRGIGKALRMRACEIAREQNFNCVLVEPGHGATRHIWTHHLGATIRAEIKADDFKSSKGKAQPLKGVDGSVAVCEIVLRRSVWDWTIFRPYYIVKLIVTVAV